MIESLPDYQNAIRDGKEARPTVKDASMNDAIEMKVSNLDDYQEGDDEAIDLGAAPGYEDGYMPITASGLSSLYNNKPSWGFSTLNDADNGSTPNSPVDFGGADDLMSNSDASDGVQHGSSASSRSMQGRLDDFDAAEVDEDFREATPPPDLPEGDQLSFFDLHNDLRAIARQGGAAQELGEWEGEVVGQGMLNVEVPELMDDEVEDEEEAMEIHVEEGEGLGGKSERK